jgi:uncharacterized surface protein with fasciclin (FAS1) repeats
MRKSKSLIRHCCGAMMVLAMCLSGCSDSDDVGDSYSTFNGLTVADYLTEHADSLSEFTAAMKEVGAYNLLKATGKYTCFIPTNSAMEAYYKEKGITSYKDMNTKDLKQFVYYHFLDGETNGSKAYTTEDFTGSALPDQNMTGRYITTDLDAKTPYWILNKTSKDIHPDISSETEADGTEKDIVNGVIHIIDHVMEGSMDLLPDYIQSKGDFTIFYQALHATGLADSLTKIEDDTYVQLTTAPDGSDLSTQTQKSYPEKRLYGFTALAEPDSIYARRAGIKSLDDLRAYAKKIYDPIYPDAAGITDETNPENSLNRFIAYHLLDKKVPLSKFVHTYGYVSEFSWFDATRKNDICYDGSYTIEEYHVSMAPNALIYMQKKGATGNIAINTARNVFTDISVFTDTTTVQFITSKSDQECKNGMLHAINNILVYDDNVKNTVLHRRMRIEMQTFLPELTTNNINSYINRYNQWWRYIPTGYCKNLTFKEQRPSIFMCYYAPNVQPQLWGDNLIACGFFDITFKVEAIPAGKYEVRFGYHAVKAESYDEGVTQVYFDGTPCGIPINMAQTATEGAIGWKCDYEIYGLDASWSASAWTSSDDPQGLENDKTLRNHGFMKAPDSYTGTVYNNNFGDTYATARNSDKDLRRILGTFTFTKDGSHNIEFVQMKGGGCEFDFIEFIPVDLLDKEDRH